MDLLTLWCVFSKGKHPREIPSIKELSCEPILLTKKQAEEERKRSKNLCWPYSPAIYVPLRKSK